METTNAKVIEAFFNILHQDTSRAFDLAMAKKVAIIAKIPLDSGWLSGKYTAESTFDDIRKRWSKEDIQIRAQLVKSVKTIVDEQENLARKAISFCLSYEAVATVIPGNVNSTQLVNNVESINHPISQEIVKQLENFYENEVKSLHLSW
jgi:aryl-alcohol dehydrogenase-like predicted oxidoreductase